MDIDLRNNIYEQGNRIYGVIKEIDQVSHSNYPDSEKLEKFNHIRDELNRIYEQSIALPEFLDVTKKKGQEGYEVIPRILTAWDDVQEKLSQTRRNLFGYSKNSPSHSINPTTDVIQSISNNLALVNKLTKSILCSSDCDHILNFFSGSDAKKEGQK